MRQFIFLWKSFFLPTFFYNIRTRKHWANSAFSQLSISSIFIYENARNEKNIRTRNEHIVLLFTLVSFISNKIACIRHVIPMAVFAFIILQDNIFLLYNSQWYPFYSCLTIDNEFFFSLSFYVTTNPKKEIICNNNKTNSVGVWPVELLRLIDSTSMSSTPFFLVTISVT